LKRDSVVAFFATTAADNKTWQVEYLSLGVISIPHVAYIVYNAA